MRRLLVALFLLASSAEAQDFIRYYPAGGSGQTVQLIANTNVSVTTTGTVEEILYTITVPASSFQTTYSGIRIRCIGKHAANTNAGSLRVRVGGIGGTIVQNRNSTVSNEIVTLDTELRVFSATSLIPFSATYQTSSAAIGTPGATEVTGLTFTSAIDIVITSVTSVQAGDMVLRNVSVDLIK